jgi:hypothetical protein
MMTREDLMAESYLEQMKLAVCEETEDRGHMEPEAE